MTMDMLQDKEAWRTAYRSRIAALERVRMQELATLTEERARAIMASLIAAETPWRPPNNWSGLVEQQALFKRWRKQ